MKPRVYVLSGVLSGSCVGDRYIIGIYSSDEAAEKERQEIIETDSHYKLYPTDLAIEEFILDERGEI